MNMLVKDFIKSTLIKEVKEMTTFPDGYAKHPYIGFSLVAASVEVLGACLDEEDWNKTGLSEKRFRLAIRELFPASYQTYNDLNNQYDLYKGLRCSLVHVLQPGSFISLSERKHEETSGVTNQHLTEQNNKLLLIYEDFLRDYIEGAEEVIRKIENNEINNPKVYTHNISVPSDSI